MAQVLDSPHSSPLSNRSVLSMNLGPSDLQRIHLPGTRVRGRAVAEVDPFAFQDSEDENHDDEEKTSMMEKDRRGADYDMMDNLLVDNSSQLSLLSQKSQASLHPDAAASQDVITQNADFTQMTQDANDASLSQLSPVPPTSPISPLGLPWGRLMPSHGGPAVELMPKSPEAGTAQTRAGASYGILGLERLHASDVFNSYTFGRSPKVAVRAQKLMSNSQEKEQRLQDWAYALISNRHCQIYCTLPEDPKAACLPGSTILPSATLQVWVEDSSHNGTLINGTVLLTKGQKRLLHSGDEISLVNPETLCKKIRDDATVKKIQKQYSYIFVNVTNQQRQPTAMKQPRPFAHILSGVFPMPTSSAKRRMGLVNPRAMNYPTGNRSPKPGGHRSPAAATNLGYRFAQPTPKSCHNRSGNRSRVGAVVSAQPEPDPSSLRRIEQEYDIRDLLGRGICEVRRAIHRVSGKEFAVKIVSLPSPGLLTHKQQEETNQLKKEADIMRGLKHPYIVDLVDVFLSNSHLYLVMELCNGGDLFDSIVKQTKYSETDSRRCMRRLLSAINYIHEDCQLVHRDLKPENILLTSMNDPCDVKVTDFGVAKSALSDLKTFCGTPSYIAPEVLLRRHTVMHTGKYGKAADMWSLGVILYILCSGVPPYNIDGAAGMDIVLQQDLKIEFPEKHWSSVSAEAKDLIRKLLDKDPRSRISVRDAMEHPWIMTEDGDTHRHPLEDPKLFAVTKKRLFSPLNGPIPVTTATSPPRKAPSRKRRKVSMENELERPAKPSMVEAHESSKSPGTVTVASPPQRPLSPVENTCESPASTPPASPSAKKLAVTKLDENDENCDHQAIQSPAMATQPFRQTDGGPKAVSDTKVKPTSTKESKGDGLVMAAELDEDRICSQFTDEEASISSFSVASASGKLSSSSGAHNVDEKDKIQGKATKVTIPKAKTNTASAGSKKNKKSNTGANKSSKTNKTNDGDGPQNINQPTLARWFQPLKKS